MTTTTTTTTTTARTTPARRPALERTVAMRLAATEYEQFLAQLGRLSAGDWSRPTECPAWDVQAMVGHVVGMAEMSASIPEQLRQMRAARLARGVFVDALTAVQVAKHAQDTPTELVARFASVSPKAARGRRRTPGFVRNRRIPQGQLVGGQLESWTFGYLVDVILTRDTWMHRIDLALAVGQEPELSADHDAILVADVVQEWAGRHGQPCQLILTGPAGGRWTFGAGREAITYDALEFCRGLSDRGPAALGQSVPF